MNPSLRPAQRLLAWVAGWVGVALVGVWLPELAVIGGFLGIGLLLLALYDVAPLYRLPALRSERIAPESWALGVWQTVKLRLHNPSTRVWTVEVFDHYPEQVELAGQPQISRLPPQGWVEQHYQLRPLRRGDAQFGPTELRLSSPWGLWQRRLQVGSPQAIRIYPNFAAVAHYALLATDNHLSHIGVWLKRRRGEGTEFHQLRDYRPGDSLRQIDWAATARSHRFIAREYQDERDQQIVFVLDCGRRMRAREADLSHFDHALNAMFLLAHVALRQGDAVGLHCFSGSERRFTPIKGQPALQQLLQQTYDLEPTLQAADYLQAAQAVLQHQRKRALILFISNIQDEDLGELAPSIRLLRQRHLVVFASLREAALDALTAQPVRDFSAALNLSAAQLYLQARAQAHETLRQPGVHLLDITPDQLPIALINLYLTIKRSGQL